MRAVGFNPEAARYGGVSVARNYFLAMAISGAFAGLAGALDITGWEYRIGENDIQASTIGFIGLAAALLGRNTAVGVGFASLLFGALINGTSGRQLDPSIFRPDLAGNLTTIIQGLVILFVGLNLGGVAVWLKKRRRRGMTAIAARVGGIRWTAPEDGRDRRDRARRARVLARAAAARSADAAASRSLLGLLAIAAGIWAWSRDQRRVGGGRDRGRRARDRRSACSRRARRARTSTPSSSGARCSPRRCATRRRSRSPRSAGSSASGAA